MLGTNDNDALKSTSGNDLFKGNGGHDTFVFKSDFGADVIKGFDATGRHHDVVQFSKSVFDNFADVLSHAAQSGHDVAIHAGGSNTLTLKDTKLAPYLVLRVNGVRAGGPAARPRAGPLGR